MADPNTLIGADPNSGAGDLIKDTTTASFATDVIQASREVPVLVDFWAPWCGPCKQLTPILEKIVEKAKGAVRLVKMDIDQNPEIPGQLGIQSIPAVIAFKNGQPLDGFMGAVPEAQIVAFIERIAGPIGPTETERLAEEGEARIAAEDWDGAGAAFSEVLTSEPENVSALAGLARALVGNGALDDAESVLDKIPEADVGAPAVAAARAALDLARQTASLGDQAELEKRLEADPADHQARFDLAVALAGGGAREDAVDHLIEIVQRKRDWNEEAARKQLLQFFEAWGPKDEMTLYGRRRLSSVLFS